MAEGSGYLINGLGPVRQAGKTRLVETACGKGHEDRPAPCCQMYKCPPWLGLPVDVIVTAGGQMARAARQATDTVAIVAIGPDLVALGLASSLAQPGGNVTGLQFNPGRERLPSVFGLRQFADAGGLMTYSTNLAEVERRAAQYVDKILKGAKPGELAIEQPTRFEFVINLKTAAALGITIPAALLLTADEVIQWSSDAQQFDTPSGGQAARRCRLLVVTGPWTPSAGR